jgi:phenylalanyl-tRNA synthetase alpha chain
LSFESLKNEAKEEIEKASSVQEVQEIYAKYLGRKGLINELFSKMKDMNLDEKKKIGMELNSIKDFINEVKESKLAQIKEREIYNNLSKLRIDTSLPGDCRNIGTLHPLTKVIDKIISIFVGIGYSIFDGPEIESDYYNFEALNIPKDHPAREMQDSFYLSNDFLLRTHTSPVQIRAMQSLKPPIRIIAPGKTYRRDAKDSRHSPVFHQVEGLAIGKRISFANLKGTLEYFAKSFFGEDCEIQFRPSYFPFTEPSAEVDIKCIFCEGKGCTICSHTGWLEVLGAGMVHPNVLRNVGYNPEEWQGFAFGMGPERLAMLKYSINDIRLFYDNDIRFIHSFIGN